MTGQAVVFLGSSLPVSEASTILDAIYLPPARAGDVLRAVDRFQPHSLAIVDGLFEQVPSVRHKEVLHAISLGVRTYGAASMGALRAAELADFGMVGVGRVYDLYALGDIDGDDEVAISHGSADESWRPMSEAMVNIRWATWRALLRGIVSGDTHDAVVSSAASTFYPLRHWRSCCEAAREHGASERELSDLLAFVETEKPDVKAADTRDLLRRVRADGGGGAADGQHRDFELAETAELRRWLEDSRAASATTD